MAWTPRGDGWETMDIDMLLFETASAVILAVVLLAIFQRI
jgi:hypothetical protein